MSEIFFNIRKATVDDCEELFRLVKELAEYEKQPNAVRNDVKSLERDGFLADQPSFECLVVDDPENIGGSKPKLIAYAMYCLVYSFKEGKTIDFRDIYVVAKYRGHGVGKKLFSAVCREAVKHNAAAMKLIVLDWNPANSFYKKLGMINVTKSEGWQCHVMKHSDIDKISHLFP